MALAQFIGAKAEPFRRAGAKVLHQDITLSDELGHHLASGLALDVNRQRALAAVRGNKQRRELAGLVDNRAAATGDVATDRFDLEHIGALVRQKHRRIRTRHNAGQVQHAHATQRAGHWFFSLVYSSFAFRGTTSLVTRTNTFV